MNQFKNLKDVMAYFSDEKVCRDYLEQLRWNGKPVCPHCGAHRPYKLKDGKTYRCSWSKCRKDFTVLVGSLMENTKIPLSTWLAAIYLATAHKKGISSCQLARDLGISQKTAWFLLHRIREMVKPHNQIELKETVQVDETYVKGKAKNRTKAERKKIASGERKDDAAVVLGMVQNDSNAVLKVIPNAEGETLLPQIQEVVKDSETIIVTDAFISYSKVEDNYKGHIIINHSNDEYVNGVYHTNSVEGFFSLFKRGIYGIYHSCSKKHLQRYCEEFAYRYNTRKIKDGERFSHALTKLEGRLTYNNLIQKEKRSLI